MNKISNSVKVHMTVRDWSQSLHGTRVSAENMIEATENWKDYGVNSIECAGGTFGQFFVRDDRDPYEFVGKLARHYEGAERTMLNRNECGLSVSRQKPDVLEYILRRHAQLGIECVNNFHHDNDPAMMRAITHITGKLQDEGHNFYIAANLAIQSNPNTMAQQEKIISDLLQDTEDMLKQGRDIDGGAGRIIKKLRFKNANGVLCPDFTYAATTAFKNAFDIEIGLHTHNSYGDGYQNAIAFIEAGGDSIDGLPEALAEGTGQISLQKLDYLLREQGVSRGLNLNFNAMRLDEDAAYTVRALYSATELPYDKDVLKSGKDSGSAGGAITSLRSLVAEGVLSRSLNTDDWSVIQKTIYEKKKENRAAFGYVTNVTPAENIQDMQAAGDVYGSAQAGKPVSFGSFGIGTIALLSGELGRVPKGVDKDVQNKALAYKGLTAPVIPKPFEQLSPGLGDLKAQLEKSGIEDPTDEEASYLALNSAKGAAFVKKRREHALNPQEPQFPRNLQNEGAIEAYKGDIFKAAYMSLELYKIADGHYDGVDYRELYEEGGIEGISQDQIEDVADEFPQLDWKYYALELRAELTRHMDALKTNLRMDGADSSVTLQVNRSILSIGTQLGLHRDKIAVVTPDSKPGLVSEWSSTSLADGEGMDVNQPESDHSSVFRTDYDKVVEP